MHTFRSSIFAVRIACDSGPTCFVLTLTGLQFSLNTATAVHICWSVLMSDLNGIKWFLAICRRPSVCRLSVAFMRPTQAIEIFLNVSMPFGTFAICWHPGKILRRSSHGNPSVRELNTRGVAEYSDFGPIECCISETVRDRRYVSINH